MLGKIVCYQEDGAFVWRQNHETVRIEPWGKDSLRIRATLDAQIRDNLVGALLPPEPESAEIVISGASATIRNGAIMAEVASDGCLRFVNAMSHTDLVAEQRPERATRIPPRSFRPLAGELYHLEARFTAYEGERCYGLGQHPHG